MLVNHLNTWQEKVAKGQLGLYNMHSGWQGLINPAAALMFCRRIEMAKIIFLMIRYIIESKMTSMVWILD